MLHSEHNSNNNNNNNNNNKTSWKFLECKLDLQIACACPFTVMMEILSWFKFSETKTFYNAVFYIFHFSSDRKKNEKKKIYM